MYDIVILQNHCIASYQIRIVDGGGFSEHRVVDASGSTEAKLKDLSGGDQREFVRVSWQRGSQPVSQLTCIRHLKLHLL